MAEYWNDGTMDASFRSCVLFVANEDVISPRANAGAHFRGHAWFLLTCAEPGLFQSHGSNDASLNADIDNRGDHRQMIFHWHAVGDAIAGAKRVAAPAFSPFKHFNTALTHRLRRLPAEEIQIYSTKDGDSPTPFPVLVFDFLNLVLERVFGIEPDVINYVVHDFRELAAGMEDGWSAGFVYYLHNLRNDVFAHVIWWDHSLSLEPPVVIRNHGPDRVELSQFLVMGRGTAPEGISNISHKLWVVCKHVAKAVGVRKPGGKGLPAGGG